MPEASQVPQELNLCAKEVVAIFNDLQCLDFYWSDGVLHHDCCNKYQPWLLGSDAAGLPGDPCDPALWHPPLPRCVVASGERLISNS